VTTKRWFGGGRILAADGTSISAELRAAAMLNPVLTTVGSIFLFPKVHRGGGIFYECA
jgi:hypothetical protein